MQILYKDDGKIVNRCLSEIENITVIDETLFKPWFKKMTDELFN
jgi:hypothetical protein